MPLLLAKRYCLDSICNQAINGICCFKSAHSSSEVNQTAINYIHLKSTNRLIKLNVNCHAISLPSCLLRDLSTIEVSHVNFHHLALSGVEFIWEMLQYQLLIWSCRYLSLDSFRKLLFPASSSFVTSRPKQRQQQQKAKHRGTYATRLMF